MSEENQKNVAVFIHTFLRDDLLMRCVQTVKRHMPAARMYITDGGLMTDEKEAFYKQLREDGHYVDFKNVYNYPWRKAFNEKLEQLQGESYVMKMDDDFFFMEDCNVRVLEKYLSSDENLGLVGGKVWHVQHNQPAWYVFDIRKATQTKYYWTCAKQKEKGYIICDVVPDWWLAKVEMLKDIKMNGSLLAGQGGHEDFFMRVFNRRAGGGHRKIWRVGYTNEAVVQHEKASQSKQYQAHRYENGAKYKSIWGEIRKPTRPW